MNVKQFIAFEEARDFVRSLNLKNQKEWHSYCKSGNKPKNIPSNPHLTYNSEWKGFGDWLGTETVSKKLKVFRPFEEAKAFVHTLNIKSLIEWNKYCKSGNKPADIPTAPNRSYKNEWKGYYDWFNKKALNKSEK